MRAKYWLELCAWLGAAVDDSVNGLLSDVCLDSRQLKAGDVFLALPGTHQHGVSFAVAAKAQGAWVLSSCAGEGVDLVVPDLAQRMGDVLNWFYDAPSASLRIVGITGTNGKTSSSHYVAQWLSQLNIKVAVLGTVGNGIWGSLQPSTHTTLDAPSLYRQLSAWRHDGVDVVVMEVSSHAIDQHRIAGIVFAVTALTQVTRDHLDYHHSEAAYRAVKRRLFTDWESRAQVLNIDDALGQALVLHCPAVLTYSVAHQADIALENAQANPQGFQVSLRCFGQQWQGTIPLYGAFNLENVMCALACVHALGIAWADVSPLLSQTSAVAGRMQWVRQSPVVVVDYAHTPDALEKALISLRRHIPEGQLHVVFGAGGDRDAGKRPLMGQIAERCADRVMVTDDNPRTEVPATIAQQILSATPLQMDEVYVPDRQQAICRAIEQASAHDVVLVAGKGHEDYQDVMGERRYFSDVAAVLACR